MATAPHTTAVRAPLLSIAALLVIGCEAIASPATPGSDTGSPASGAAPRSAEEASQASLPDPIDIAEAGALAIDASYAIEWPLAVGKGAWVTGIGDGLGVLDAKGRLTGEVPVTGLCEAMDTGFGAVWAATCNPGGILRIDPSNGDTAVGTFDDPVMDPEASITVGDSDVWLVCGSAADKLIGVDPHTLQVAHTYAIPSGGAAVRAGFSGLWVTLPTSNQLLRVDEQSGNVAAINVPGGPRFVAVGLGGVWVLDELDGRVTRVDPATDGIVATIQAGGPVIDGSIAIGGGSVWVKGPSGLLSQIDPKTNAVVARYGPSTPHGRVAASADAVWLTDPDTATVWRLPIH
jgi:streptogramin lyase